MSELEIVLEYLPITLRKEIISNIGTEENKIEEIRLRSNKRLCLKIGPETVLAEYIVRIVGSGVIENGQVININYISSLNIRIARQQIGCSQKVMSNIINSETNTIYNTLIISPPRMWKNNIIKRYNKKLK